MDKYVFDMLAYAKSVIECLEFKDVRAETDRQVFCDWVGTLKCHHCEGGGYYLHGNKEGEPCMMCDSFDNIEKTLEEQGIFLIPKSSDFY